MYIKNLRKLFNYFAGEDRKSIIVYILISYFAAFLEFLGVAIVYPFILLLLKPELAEKLPFSFSPLLFGVLIFSIFIFKNAYMLFCIKKQTKIIKNIESGITKFFVSYFLNAPYNISSAIPREKKERVINVLIPNVVSNYLLRFLNLNINLSIVIFILLLIFVKYPIPAFVTTIFTLVFVSFQNHIYKRRLGSVSKINWEKQKEFNLLKAAILSNLKLIKLNGAENEFEVKANSALESYNEAKSESLCINSLQPYLLEPFIIILLFVLLGTIAYTTGDDKQVLIASFSVVASAIFRILPALSRVQVSINSIIIGKPFAEELLSFYEACSHTELPPKISSSDLWERIDLCNISFSYGRKKVLNELNLEIKRGQFVGIIGESGAGKTTLVDIMCGLLKPNEGSIFLDGKSVSGLWGIAGYVPQEPVFFNAPIRENIAFGSSEIDDVRVCEVLKMVGLLEFIQENFKNGIYDSPLVDSMGLSVGQKQRLSIARALYSKPQILILDEATSALDLQTERDICEIFKKIKDSTTIIAIAHRLSTLQSADKIVFIKSGRVYAEGTYSELCNTCTDFRELVSLQNLLH